MWNTVKANSRNNLLCELKTVFHAAIKEEGSEMGRTDASLPDQVTDGSD